MNKYIKNLFLSYKYKLILLFFILLISMITGYVYPHISKNIIDKGLTEKNIKALVFFCVIALIISSVNCLLNVIKEKIRLVVYNGIKYRMERDSFRHLLRIKMDYFQKDNISAIYNTIKNDIGSICSIAHIETFEILTGFFTAIGGAVALAKIEWRMLIALIFFIPINVLITYIMSKNNYEVVKKYIDESKNYNSWFSETMQGVKIVRLFGLQNSKNQKLKEKQSNLLKYDIKQSMMQTISNELITIILEILSLSGYIISGYFLIKNNLTLGDVIAFQTYSLMITSPIVQGLGMLFSASSIIPSLKRYKEFMNYPEEEEKGYPCSENGKMVFDNVSFGYEGKENLISNLNFEIEKGSKVAILGRNGAGKTTLLNLILRIITPINGSIRFAGRTIQEYDIVKYRELFGVVSQDIFLFNSTIKENICFDNDISEDELLKVIDKVNLNTLVKERGLDYIVGENGSMLSGGQKQKIAIARALILKRPIMILDEATSNLDKETIEMLSEMFETDLKDTTILCVTHTDSIADLFNVKIRI